MSERSKVLDSKSSVAQVTGGSNPPLSARQQGDYQVEWTNDFWRGDRAAEGTSLLNWRGGNPTAGSNPASSAVHVFRQLSMVLDAVLNKDTNDIVRTKRLGSMAQRIEHLSTEQGCGGSNPPGSTNDT